MSDNGIISFFVPGIPQTAGSKRAFPVKKNGTLTGKNIVVDANPKSKDWKARVAHEAELAMAGRSPMSGPLEVEVLFRMPRIGGHYRQVKSTSGMVSRCLKDNAPVWPIVRPDVLKLTRAFEDACTGILWHDDSQIVHETMIKQYCESPGLSVRVFEKLEPGVKRRPEPAELSLA